MAMVGIYGAEFLGEYWLRDNSAYHETQRNDPLCGTEVIITDEDVKEYGRKGVITKIPESGYKITLKEYPNGEEFVYLNRWQFKMLER